MTTLKTFLNMLDEFVHELEETFPEEKKIKTYKMKLDTMKSTNPRLILDTFVKQVKPCISYITTKDESFILEEKFDFVKDLNLKELWQKPQVNAETKEAIWAHMNTLQVFSTTISSIPDDLLTNIEQVAEQCASSFDANTDPSNLMAGMQQMLQNQLNLQK